MNNRYRALLEAAGMILSGLSPDGRLVEIVELRDHPWFVASQFHPEFKSRPERPHPLFDGFVATAVALRDGREPVLRSRDERLGLPTPTPRAAAPDVAPGAVPAIAPGAVPGVAGASRRRIRPEPSAAGGRRARGTGAPARRREAGV